MRYGLEFNTAEAYSHTEEGTALSMKKSGVTGIAEYPAFVSRKAVDLFNKRGRKTALNSGTDRTVKIPMMMGNAEVD